VTRLQQVGADVRDVGVLPLSIASTQGVLSMPESRLDVVRPGIALLGVAPHAERLDAAIVHRLELRPIVTWKARVAYVKVVPRGECVGYGRRPELQRDTPIATLAVGWADGYPQTLQGVGTVLLGGRRCPVLAISANSTMVDVTGVDGVERDDAAVLLGHQGSERIAVEEIARVIGSFYRVLAGIPRSAPRIWGSRGDQSGILRHQ
jgi:alanine racemase